MKQSRRGKGSEIHKVARQQCGYERLRPGQEEAVRAVLDERDVLVIMPTGSGKSAIYQIAALMIEGSTVVVSPLIALQRDQLESIDRQELAKAAAVNSLQRASEQREVARHLDKGRYEFIFLAPEQFSREKTLARVKASKPSLFVVDEAHCVSKWGHSFRPDYLKLGAVIDELGHPTVLALTATASPAVRDEVIERLHMRDAAVFVHGFDRPTIELEVQAWPDEDSKRKAFRLALNRAERPGIIYASTRKHAEELGGELADAGRSVVVYHGGMTKEERDRSQEDFMSGDAEVIVATNAFGMGIDKPDVRFVYHYDVADSLDSYYQEIGRAGRDGKLSQAILFYRRADLGLHRFFASGGQVNDKDVARVAQTIDETVEPRRAKDVRDAVDLSQAKTHAAIQGLEEVGAVKVLATGELESDIGLQDVEEAARQAVRVQEERRRLELWRIEMMQGYAETEQCRRQFLLNYFGEPFEPPCGNCDNCKRGARPSVAVAVGRAEDALKPFPLKSFVMHKQWGKGMVVRYDRNKIVVSFDEAGYKTFLLDLVVEKGLLKPLH